MPDIYDFWNAATSTLPNHYSDGLSGAVKAYCEKIIKKEKGSEKKGYPSEWYELCRKSLELDNILKGELWTNILRGYFIKWTQHYTGDYNREYANAMIDWIS